MPTHHFSPSGFWKKVARFFRRASYEVVEKALWLYFTYLEPSTPAWAKAVIASALGYFIMPVDAIPDAIPAGGYTDDAGVIAAAVAAVAIHITPEVKRKTREVLKNWFGDSNE